jgi:hypothetical protein
MPARSIKKLKENALRSPTLLGLSMSCPVHPGGCCIEAGNQQEIAIWDRHLRGSFAVGSNLTVGSSPNTNPGFANDVLISGVDGAWFTNSYFDPALVNFALTNADPTVLSVDGILISNSWFDLGAGSILFQASGSSSTMNTILLTGNIFNGGTQSNQGINISGNANFITITGNTFNGFQLEAISLAGTVGDFTISNTRSRTSISADTVTPGFNFSAQTLRVLYRATSLI